MITIIDNSFLNDWIHFRLKSFGKLIQDSCNDNNIILYTTTINGIPIFIELNNKCEIIIMFGVTDKELENYQNWKNDFDKSPQGKLLNEFPLSYSYQKINEENFKDIRRALEEYKNYLPNVISFIKFQRKRWVIQFKFERNKFLYDKYLAIDLQYFADLTEFHYQDLDFEDEDDDFEDDQKNSKALDYEDFKKFIISRIEIFSKKKIDYTNCKDPFPINGYW